MLPWQDSLRFEKGSSYTPQEAKRSALHFGEVTKHELIAFSNCVMTFALSYKASNGLIETLAQDIIQKQKLKV